MHYLSLKYTIYTDFITFDRTPFSLYKKRLPRLAIFRFAPLRDVYYLLPFRMFGYAESMISHTAIGCA